MSKIKVTIRNVQCDVPFNSKEGKEYLATIIKYKHNDVAGEQRVIQTDHVNSVKLQKVLRKLSPDDEVVLELKKNGNFTNLVNILPSNTPEEEDENTVKFGGTKTFNNKVALGKFDKQPTHPQDAARMSRSKALEIAVAFAKDQDEQTVLQIAEHFSNYILEGTQLQTVTNTTVKVTSRNKKTSIFDNEDVPFDV